jgi:hypothetical protein
MITCDRCHKEQPNASIEQLFSCGVYVVQPGSAWAEYGNPGENIVCDACMWADPRYIKTHGTITSC